MPDAPASETKPSQAEISEKPETPKEDEPEPTITVENGRRRGKRRVMKKKTVKDEEGYLGKFIRQLSANKGLTSGSDQRGGSMGIIFGRRARAKASETCA